MKHQYKQGPQKNALDERPETKAVRALRAKYGALVIEKGVGAIDDLLSGFYRELLALSLVYGFSITAEMAAGKELRKVASPEDGAMKGLEEMRKQMKLSS